MKPRAIASMPMTITVASNTVSKQRGLEAACVLEISRLGCYQRGSRGWRAWPW